MGYGLLDRRDKTSKQCELVEKECSSLNQTQRLKPRLFPICRLERPVKFWSDPDRQPDCFFYPHSLSKKKANPSVVCFAIFVANVVQSHIEQFTEELRTELAHSDSFHIPDSCCFSATMRRSDKRGRMSEKCERDGSGEWKEGVDTPHHPTSPVLVVCGTPLRENAWGAALKSPWKVLYIILQSCPRKGGSGWKG